MPGLVDLKRQNARGTYPSNLDWQNLRRQNYGFQLGRAERRDSSIL